MSATIPDDIMTAARFVAADMDDDPWCETRALKIACALLSERESATKAERERCAERFEKAATLQGRQECCGYPTSAHECCADPLYMISDRDGARAIRNGADFVPAAAIRKGDGE